MFKQNIEKLSITEVTTVAIIKMFFLNKSKKSSGDYIEIESLRLYNITPEELKCDIKIEMLLIKMLIVLLIQQLSNIFLAFFFFGWL